MDITLLNLGSYSEKELRLLKRNMLKKYEDHYWELKKAKKLEYVESLLRAINIKLM